MEDAYRLPVKAVFDRFAVEPSRGLSDAQVKENLKKYGKNELPSGEQTSLFTLILEQFQDKLVLILLASAVVSFALALLEEGTERATAFVEPVVILLILIGNATVGVVQETNAEKAIEALMEYSPDEATVLRSGKTSRIHASNLVPGDIVSVAVGDKVPADCRLTSITSSSFTVDQAMLTGESESVSKDTDPVDDPKAVNQDKVNMLFSGTTVASGTAQAVVTLTGARTAIGDIHKSISTQIAEKTPLKQKLDDFGDMLAKVIGIVCLLVWLINLPNFNDPAHHGWLRGAIYFFKVAVALAVAAIPEGLSAVITTCLALGTAKMAKKNAIVRSLPSVETLGSVQVVASDKTGTLTTNQMSVSKFTVFDGVSMAEYHVEGTTFSPEGRIIAPSGSVLEAPCAQNTTIASLAQICSVCNNAKISLTESAYTNVGEPTEAALRVLVEKLRTEDAAFNSTLATLGPQDRVNAVNDHLGRRFQRKLTFEFSRDRKSMSVLASDSQTGGANLFVKGAPEAIIERCTTIQTPTGLAPLTPEVRRIISERILDYGRQGLRSLAMAVHTGVDPDAAHYKTKTSAEYVRFEQDLTFVGIAGMLDPPRPEVRGAIEKCRAAGIRVIVITGDEKNTAETICRQIGIFGPNEDLTGKSYTGREFDALPQSEKVTAALHASLFSRTEPGHKQQLVEILQGQSLIVAMTGDGVNDAPALKRANVGIAMGTGTDVAKLAGDVILADDNFASIEQAIEEGRTIYENTKAFVRYLISSNIGEVVSIFLTVLLGLPEALTSVTLLWVNLVTDGLPAVALGFNRPDHGVMKRPPRDPKEPLVGSWLLFRYIVIGSYVGAATVAGYAWWYIFYPGGPQLSYHQLSHFRQCSTQFPEIGCEIFGGDAARKASTVSLSILVTIEMFNAMNALSENESLLTLPIWTNLYLVAAIALSMSLHVMILYVPFFSNLFDIKPLNWQEWQAVLLFSIPVIVIDELLKLVSQQMPTTISRKSKDL